MGRSEAWSLIFLMMATTLLPFTGPTKANELPAAGGHIRIEGDSELLSSSYYITGSGDADDPIILSGFPKDHYLEITNISYWIELRDQAIDVDTENTALTLDNVTGCYLENISLKNTATLFETDIQGNLSINGSAFNFAFSPVATTNAMDVGAQGNISLRNSSISFGYPAGTSDNLCLFGSRNFDVKWSRFDNVQIIYISKGDSINVRECSFSNGSILWPKVYLPHSRNIIVNSTLDNSCINVMESSDLLISNNSFINRTSCIIFGRYPGSHPDTGRYNILTGNRFEACNGLTVRGGGFATKTIRHWLIHDNYFGNCSSPAIEWDYKIQSIDDIFIWRNIFYHNRGTGDVKGNDPQISILPGLYTGGPKENINISRDGVGNYWRDHTSPDANGDGIVDSEYRVYTSSNLEAWDNITDLYPLSNRFFDLTRPHLKVLEPLESITDQEYTRIRWEAWDEGSGLDRVLISRDMENWTDVTNEEWWSVRLSPGENQVHLKAYDKAGLFDLTSVTMELIGIAGPIRLISPKDGVILRSDEVSVTWKVDDIFPLSRQELEVDDGSLELTAGDREKYIFLDDGTHHTILRCCDPKGTNITKEADFIVDTLPPKVEICAPLDGAVITDQLVHFKWKVFDVNGIASRRYRVDSKAWIDPGDVEEHSFSAFMEAGEHILEVEAYDIAGRKTVGMVSFTIGNGTLTITEPADGLVTKQDNITIKWTIDEDFIPESVELRNIESGNSHDVTGLNELEVKLPSQGRYRFQVTAKDEFGNKASDILIVYRDIKPPSIHIFNEEYDVNDEPLIVRWSGLDTHGVSGYGYRLDVGDWIDIGDQTILELGEITETDHVLEVMCTDRAGNTAIDLYEFLYDLTPPRVSFVPDGEVRISRDPIISLDWTLKDENGISNVSLIVGNSKFEFEPTTNGWEGILGEGVVMIEVTAYDHAGNHGNDTIKIITDTVNPFLDWREPSFARSNLEAVLFRWWVSDEVGVAYITLEEDHIQVWSGSVDGEHEISLTPEEGPHLYTLTAGDISGRSTTIDKMIILDRSPPEIDDLTYLVEDRDLTVEWKVHDELIEVTDVILHIGNRSFRSQEMSGSWKVEDLGPGLNILHIQVIDGAGNSAEETLDIHIEGQKEEAGGGGILYWFLIILVPFIIIAGAVLAFTMLYKVKLEEERNAGEAETASEHGGVGNGGVMSVPGMKVAPGLNASTLISERRLSDRRKK